MPDTSDAIRRSASAAVQMLKVAAELEDSAWEGALELEGLRDAGAADQGSSYDILDSLRADPPLAPLLVYLQDDGIGLGDDTDQQPTDGGAVVA
jgi:hypothetical protein